MVSCTKAPLGITVMNLATLGPRNRLIECSNTRKSIGNGFLIEKYVEAVVRKLSQLAIVAERVQFENKNLLAKKKHRFSGQTGGLKKNKTIL